RDFALPLLSGARTRRRRLAILEPDYCSAGGAVSGRHRCADIDARLELPSGLPVERPHCVARNPGAHSAGRVFVFDNTARLVVCGDSADRARPGCYRVGIEHLRSGPNAWVLVKIALIPAAVLVCSPM